MDLWGVGCVFFEILSLFPLFPGDNELDQIHKIHNILGTPSMEISKFLSHVSAECQDLILKLLCYNPEERYSAKQALNHAYFKDMVEQEQKLAKLSTNQFKS